MDNAKPVSKGTVISAIFLVAGTCTGGGMLALPVATGVSGFVPSIFVMFICWIAMTLTGLLLLEASLWMKEGEHVISMAARLLGPLGKAMSWLLYLFICYASMVAYTAGGGGLLALAIHNILGLEVSKELGCLIFIVLFGVVIYIGSQVVGRVNAVLFVAMIAAYVALVGMGTSEVKLEYLSNHNWPKSILAIPLLLTSFSFQTMVPSLSPMLKNHAQSLRWAIIAGTTITFIIYFLWQMIVLGIIPIEGPKGLMEALIKGEPATPFLREHVGNSYIGVIAEYFAFFAIVTSFLGIGLGLFDFLSDGLKIKKEGLGKVFLAVLIIVPSVFFATHYERVFLVALDTSGGFGDSILNGIFPVLMVWVGRYRQGIVSNFRVFGGKPLLIIVLLFFVFSLGVEILVHTGHLDSIYNIHDVPILIDEQIREGSQ